MVIDDNDNSMQDNSFYEGYSTAQLQLLFSRLSEPKRGIVGGILQKRYKKKAGGSDVEDPAPYSFFFNRGRKTKGVADVKVVGNNRKKKEVKGDVKTAVVTSDIPSIQSKIDDLPNLVGSDLIYGLAFLKSKGIDIEFISFLNRLDEVSFRRGSNISASSSKQKVLLHGKVVLVSLTDSRGVRYCRIKEYETGKLFRKRHIDVIRIKTWLRKS